jgi:hypothetical protein
MLRKLLVPLVCLTILCGASFAQTRIARANQAADGQQAIYTVVGNQTAVCLDLFQMDNAGNLLTLSSYYVAPLSTQNISAPTITHFKTTAVFAISEPGPGNAGVACKAVPGSFISDPAREPQVYQALVGGDNPVIKVNQLNAALTIAAAICQPGPTDGGAAVTINAGCIALNNIRLTQVNIADVNQVVVFGFEEVSFLASSGAALTSALANCNAPLFNTAGATFTMTCKLPTGGTFSDQSYH